MSSLGAIWRTYVLPAAVFQSLMIGGGYGTGREIVEYFSRFGLLGGLLGLLVVWSLTGWELARVRDGYLHEAETRTVVQARVFAQNSRLLIKRVDEILLGLRPQWANDAQEFATRVRERQKGWSEVTFQVAVLDRQGRLRPPWWMTRRLRIRLSPRPLTVAPW